MIILLLLVIVTGGIFSVYSYLNRNAMDGMLASTEPFGIQLALLDDETENPLILSQMVVFPEEGHVLFYFINADAAYDEKSKPINESSLSSADRFAAFTGIANRYSIRVKRSRAVRILDILEGMGFFIEEQPDFVDAKFQYPVGQQFFSGEQIVEYATARARTDKGKEYISGVEQVLRAESVLLSLFWNRAAFSKKIEAGPIWEVVVGLFDTDLNGDELHSLVEYLTRDNAVNATVAEVPLTLQESTGYPPSPPRLVVKEQRARVIYTTFIDNLRSGRLLSDSFAIEILNGTEINGLARKLKIFFQDRGPSVLDVNNYKNKPLKHTVIVERSGNTFYAEKMLEMTDLVRERVFFRRMNLEVDLSYIVGDDINRKKMHL